MSSKDSASIDSGRHVSTHAATSKVHRIGTPHQASATRVMLLGSGELGKEMAIAFQRLGVEVIAVDRYPAAPAQQVAHTSHVVDMTSEQELYELIAAERPDLVLPEIEAISLSAIDRAESEGLTTVIPNARAVGLTMNREGIRTLAAQDLGIPTSRYAFVSSRRELSDAVAEIGYPCVVKPVMSSSGKGQSVLHSDADLESAWTTAVSSGRVSGQRMIVEAYVDFDYEVTLLTVRAMDPNTGEVATHFCEPIGHRQENGDYVESWQPQPMSQGAYDAARSVAARITSALGGLGVFGVELFVSGVDVYFSEVSPRPHDTGMVTLRSQMLSEFELHARAVLGLPVSTTLTTPGASAVVFGENVDTDVNYFGVDEALAVPETDVRIFAKPDAVSKRRMAVAISTAESTELARQRARSAAARIQVR